MIPITINGKKHLIKSANELTTKEFIDFMKTKNPDKIKLIGFQTGRKYDVIFKTKISKNVLMMIGEIPDIEKLKPPKTILGYHINRFGIETVGQRFQLETSGYKGYELLLFVVAVALTNDPDLDKVNMMKERLLNEPFIQVMGAGNFFFRNLMNGRNSGLNSLRNTLLSIRMQARKNRPA